MEEKKTSNVIAMSSKGNNAETAHNEDAPLSYEKLNELCVQLRTWNKQLLEQNENLITQIKRLDMSNVFQRLSFLFKVAEISSGLGATLFNKDFVRECVSEIEELMTIPEKEDSPEKTAEEG